MKAVEWNPCKAATNRRKHGVDFADAVARRELATHLGAQGDTR